MKKYIKISNGQLELDFIEMIREVTSVYPGEISTSILSQANFILGQNEFNSRDYYIAFEFIDYKLSQEFSSLIISGLNSGQLNKFILSINKFHESLIEILSKNYPQKEIISGGGKTNGIKYILPDIPTTHTATPKNNEIEELLITVDYSDRNGKYWLQSNFRNKIIVLRPEESIHAVIKEALEEHDYVEFTNKGVPISNVHIDTKNGVKSIGYVYRCKTEIDGNLVRFDVWVTIKKIIDFNIETINDD